MVNHGNFGLSNNDGGGMQEVHHDGTLTGTGATPENPLKVAKPLNTANLSAFFHPKGTDEWYFVVGNFSEWNTENRGQIQFFTGTPAANTTLFTNQDISNKTVKDWSTVTHIRVAVDVFDRADWLDANYKTAATPEVGDIFYIHNDNPYNAANYATCTVSAVGAIQGTGNARYRDITVTTEQTGGDFAIDANQIVRLTDEAPADIVLNSSQISFTESFVARFLKLPNAIKRLFDAFTTELKKSTLASYVQAWITALGAFFVSIAEIQPKESDFLTNFTNDNILNPSILDKRFNLTITSDASGPPIAANAYEYLSDIVAGARTVILSAQQWKDGNFQRMVTLSTTDFDTTDEAIYLNLYEETNGYIKITPSGTPVSVGSGNGQYIYFAATVEVSGTITPGGASEDDLVAVRDREPSTFWDKTSIPWRAIVGFSFESYLNTDAIQKIITGFEALTGTWLTRLRRLIQGHEEAISMTVTRVSGQPAAAGEIRLPSIDGSGGNVLIYFPLTDTDGATIVIADLLDYQTGDYFDFGGESYQLTGGVQHFSGNIYQFGINGYDTATAPALNASGTLTFEGRDLHTGNTVKQILSRASPNLGGKGGTEKEIWTRGSSDKNASWEKPQLIGGAQQAFDSTNWTAYSSETFEDDDLLEICLSPTELGYAQPWCIRFGDVATAGGQILNTGGNTFNARRNGSSYEVQRTAGNGTLYIRIFIKGSNSS